MIAGTHILVHLHQIEDNARLCVRTCHKAGVSSVVACITSFGNFGFGKIIASTLIKAGFDGISNGLLGELRHLHDMKVTPRNGFSLSRTPGATEVPTLVRISRCCYCFNIDVVRVIQREAKHCGIIYSVWLGVATLPGTFGIGVDQISACVAEILTFENIRLLGIYGHIDSVAHENSSLEKIISSLVRLKTEASPLKELELSLSGDAVIEGCFTGHLSFSNVNEVVIDSSVIVGYKNFQEKAQSAFTLKAEVLDVFKDAMQIMARVGIGKTTIDICDLEPDDSGIVVLRSDEEYTVLDLTQSLTLQLHGKITSGSFVSFSVGKHALARLSGVFPFCDARVTTETSLLADDDDVVVPRIERTNTPPNSMTKRKRADYD